VTRAELIVHANLMIEAVKTEPIEGLIAIAVDGSMHVVRTKLPGGIDASEMVPRLLRIIADAIERDGMRKLVTQ
jgi:hypothetical protein